MASSSADPNMPIRRRSNAPRGADASPPSALVPTGMTSMMRGMQRLEIRRGMEESNYLAQRGRSGVLNAPIDMRLLDYVSDYDDNLMCPICRCPFVDPVVLRDCDHCFCRDCLNLTWTEYHPSGPSGRCPTCRTQTRLAPKSAVNKILINILDGLVVRCPKHDDGCTVEMKRGEVQDHINLYCSEAFVACPRANCEQSTRRKDASQCLHYGVVCIDCHQYMLVDNLESHWRRECPDRTIVCPQCQNDIYYRTLESHKSETCPASLSACSGSPYGCHFRSVRDDLTFHMTTCIFASLAPILSAQQRRLDEHEEINKLMKRKMNVLEEGFEKLELLLTDRASIGHGDPVISADLEQIPPTTARVRRPRHNARHDNNAIEGGDANSGDDFSATAMSQFSPSGGNGGFQEERGTAHTVSTAHPWEYTGGTDSQIDESGFVTPDRGSWVISADERAFSVGAFHHDAFTTDPDIEDPWTTTPIQHLLSLNQSMRDEVTRVAAALHELDGRHSMLFLNENLRLKEDVAFLSAQVAGMGRQVEWLTRSRLQSQSQSQNQNHQQQQQQQQHQQQQARSGGNTDDDSREARAGRNQELDDSSSGSGPMSAVAALRGAARVVTLGSNSSREGLGFGRRAGSDEGRTKL